MHSTKKRRRSCLSTRCLGQSLVLLGMLTLAIDMYLLFGQEVVLSNKPLLMKIAAAPNTTTSSSHQAPEPHRVGTAPFEAILTRILGHVDRQMIQQLPTWEQVVQQYGDKPVLYGLDSCQHFRDTIPADQRMLGSSGMFNTGTNLLTQLLKRNCEIPARRSKYGANATKELLGIRWQVSWGKHSPVRFRKTHVADALKKKGDSVNKTAILPIVTIRNPYRWMQSMCKNPYSAKWSHSKVACPNLKKQNEWNNVTVTYNAGAVEYKSLAHLWNDWYKEYYSSRDYNDESFPFVMVRMEDLIFHTEATIRAVCECAGGEIRSDFQYVMDSAKKDSPGHDVSVGLVQAWEKYSKPLPMEAGFSHDDYAAAREAIDHELMDIFRYRHAPTSTTE